MRITPASRENAKQFDTVVAITECHPPQCQFFAFPRTVQQIPIDQPLVRQSRLFRQSLEYSPRLPDSS